MSQLSIKKLSARVGDKGILKDLNLEIKSGEIHAIMGPNGSGKSTLSKVIMGHPLFEVTGGSIQIDKSNVLKMTPDERSRKGLFLAFQSPQKIPGLAISQFLRSAYNAHLKSANSKAKLASVFQFQKILEEEANTLHIDSNITARSVNEGLSGGEMKKTEILQMALLKPKIAILDEIDSGLDVDALRVVCENIMTQYRKQKFGLLLITHYYRILDYIHPDVVHIMVDGKIIKSGDASLAQEVEKKGYTSLMREMGLHKESKFKILSQKK